MENNFSRYSYYKTEQAKSYRRIQLVTLRKWRHLAECQVQGIALSRSSRQRYTSDLLSTCCIHQTPACAISPPPNTVKYLVDRLDRRIRFSATLTDANKIPRCVVFLMVLRCILLPLSIKRFHVVSSRLCQKIEHSLCSTLRPLSRVSPFP